MQRWAQLCVSVLAHRHEGAFASLEQLQSGPLPSHKDPLFFFFLLKAVTRGTTHREKITWLWVPRLMLWQQIYGRAMQRRSQTRTPLAVNQQARPASWLEPRRTGEPQKVDICSVLSLPSLLLVKPRQREWLLVAGLTPADPLCPTWL